MDETPDRAESSRLPKAVTKKVFFFFLDTIFRWDLDVRVYGFWSVCFFHRIALQTHVSSTDFSILSLHLSFRLVLEEEQINLKICLLLNLSNFLMSFSLRGGMPGSFLDIFCTFILKSMKNPQVYAVFFWKDRSQDRNFPSHLICLSPSFPTSQDVTLSPVWLFRLFSAKIEPKLMKFLLIWRSEESIWTLERWLCMVN